MPSMRAQEMKVAIVLSEYQKLYLLNFSVYVTLYTYNLYYMLNTSSVSNSLCCNDETKTFLFIRFIYMAQIVILVHEHIN